ELQHAQAAGPWNGADPAGHELFRSRVFGVCSTRAHHVPVRPAQPRYCGVACASHAPLEEVTQCVSTGSGLVPSRISSGRTSAMLHSLSAKVPQNSTPKPADMARDKMTAHNSRLIVQVRSEADPRKSSYSAAHSASVMDQNPA